MKLNIRRTLYLSGGAGALFVGLLLSCGDKNHTDPDRGTPVGRVTISTDKEYRYIRSNGIPDHATGTFPNHADPFSISEQDISVRLPLRPKIAETSTKLGEWNFGIAINGVMMDPSGPWYQGSVASGWTYDPNMSSLSSHFGVDFNNAHTQPSSPPPSTAGLYHYHGLPIGLIKRLKETSPDTKMLLVGWAADGFPVYNNYGHSDPLDVTSDVREMKSSYRLRAGLRPKGAPKGPFDGSFEQDYEYVSGLGDLDEFNGRFGITSEFPHGTYAYYITQTYPFQPRMLRGVPDESFRHKNGGNANAKVPPPIANWPVQP